MDQLDKIIKQPNIQKIFNIFNKEQDGSIFLVGGCVRDALMGIEVTDFDFAISYEPLKVIEILKLNEIKYLDMGIKFGTVTAILNGSKYEITTFRKDIVTDGRHAEVEFTKELEIDASRRDFTVNSLYADKDGKIYDFFNGQEDLKNNQLKFIGDPKQRIKEDYLRIMRFFRFLTSYSNQTLDEKLIAIFKDESHNLSIISKERIWSEFKEILRSKNPVNTFQVMNKVSIFSNIIRNIEISDGILNLIEIEEKIKMQNNYILRLSLLLNNDLKNIEDFLNDFPLTVNEAKELTELGKLNQKIVSYLSMKEVRSMLYRMGSDNFKNQIILNWAKDINNKNEVNWRSLYEVSNSWEKPDFSIKADEVLRMGIEKGPLVSKILGELEEWWIDNDFINDKFSMIERLKAICQAHK